MKKGTKVLYLNLLCLLIYGSIVGNPIEKKGRERFYALSYRTRALLKGLVYRGWVQNDNFYEVVPGELYRSSQLLPSRLEYFIKQYGIKTIINLSGDEPYYWVANEEKKLAEKYGIVLFNIKTHALTVTSLEKTRSLLVIFLSSPLPMLIHCFAGSDRTGEACALYLLASDRGIPAAISQLSPRFKHKRWLFPCKYYLITNLEKIYPNLLATMKKLCNQRLLYEDLRDTDSKEIYLKILERKIKTNERSKNFE